MARRTRWIAPGLATTILAWALQGGLAAEPGTSSDRIAQLVRELGSPSFIARERASRELTDLGIVAREALAAAAGGRDAEVRVRARAILTTLVDSDFRKRLEAFAADFDGRQRQTLPGWDQFSARFGGSRPARELFVEMQRCEGELLAALPDSGKLAGELLESRCCTLAEQVVAGPDAAAPISLGTLASLLFVSSSSGVDVDEQTDMLFYGWIQKPNCQREIRDGTWSVVLKQLLRSWMAKGGSSAITLESLVLAISFDFEPEARLLAAKALADGAGDVSVRQCVILWVGRYCGQEQLPRIEKLLQDTTKCNVLQADDSDPPVEIQIRDVALAVLVHLSGQKLRDYGYVHAQHRPETLFEANTLAFNDPAQRDAALKKWARWRTEHPEP